MIPSRSCDAIAHTSHKMHSAPLAKCEEKEEAERRRHDQFLSWCVAKGTSMSTRTLHSVAHESVYFSDPFGLRRMAAENGNAARVGANEAALLQFDAYAQRCEDAHIEYKSMCNELRQKHAANVEACCESESGHILPPCNILQIQA
jgi:hypothetical protein